MITEVHEDRLLITSDTHLGSFFCNARPKLIRFFEYASANQYNVCINGDGIDVLHTSLLKITRETADFLREFRRITNRFKITIYYTIGNHDIILEHYLADWGLLRLVPFLNVTSGRKRIRVEHGHLYHPFFMKHPRMYEAFGRFGGYICRIDPRWFGLYDMYDATKYRFLTKLRGRSRDAATALVARGTDPFYLDAAEELARRGFDAVIFGHTHLPGVLPLNRDQALYLNTGSWFGQPYYAKINRGEVELRPWQG